MPIRASLKEILTGTSFKGVHVPTIEMSTFASIGVVPARQATETRPDETVYHRKNL